MSTTIIENLFAPGDTPSGEYTRIIGALNALGMAKPLAVNSQNSLFIAPGNNSSTAFGEFRIAAPITYFDSRQFYGKDALFMVESLVGGATSTFQSNRGCVRLQCDTASGDKATRQTKPYLAYQNSRTAVVIMSAIMGAAKTNVRQRIGLFDDDNGAFFEQSGSGLSIVRRSKVTGSVVDSSIPQASWVDPLNGSGASGVTLDLSKLQTFIIARVWPGLLAFAFYINGEPIVAHYVVPDNNTLADAWASTPVLPGRFEIENTGTAASATSLDQYGVNAQMLGGYELHGPTLTFDTGTTGRTLAAGATFPLISIRLKSTHNRGILIPNSIKEFQTGTVRAMRVYVNIGGSLTGGSWVSASDAVEANITATSITGGTNIQTDFTGGDSAFTLSDIPFSLVASSDLAGNSDPLTLVCTNLTGSSATMFGAMNWEEIL